MEKFYKYFTISVLAITLLGGISFAVHKQFAPPVSAQEKKYERCRNSEVIVIEDNQQRAVHVAYDFENQTVSVVQIQKSFNPPNIAVSAKSLTGK